MKLQDEFDIDLLKDFLGWDLFDELEAYTEQLYEDQQKGVKRDLTEIRLIITKFKVLWWKFSDLNEVHKEHPILKQNQEILLLSMLVIWGTEMTVEGI